MGKRRRSLRAFGILVIVVACMGSYPLWALDYPTRPVTLFCGYSAGGAGDIQARALGTALEPLLGQSVVVSNKPGATGSIMMALLKNSKPDGYTIALTPASLAVTPYIQKVEYDIAKDFMYLVALNSYAPPFTVQAESPWKTLEDLVEYARKNPNKLKIATSGMKGSSALLTRYVAHKAGVKWTLVPFKGDGRVVTALLGGHVHVAVNNGAQIPHVKAGKLRMLAFFTEERVKDFPDVPTFKELGYDAVTHTCAGVAGPKGIPGPIVKKLTEALVKARESEVFVAAVTKLYLNPQKEVGKEFEDRLLGIYRGMDKYVGLK